MERRPWIQYYPASIPNTIDASTYSSSVHFMEEIFENCQDLPMCENMGKVLTFNAVDKLSKSFAAYIQRHIDLSVGSHAAIQLPNPLQYPIAVLGMLRGGLVVVNINPQHTPSEMAYQLKDAGVRSIVVLENFAYKLVEILPDTIIQTIIDTKIGDMLGSIKGKLLNFAIKHIKKLVPTYSIPQAISFKEVLAKGKEAIFYPVALKFSDIAFLQYTGGTTGISKGAVLSHQNLKNNFQQLEPVIRLFLKEKEERIMIPLPLYHILGLDSLFEMAKLGAKCLLITNPKDIPRFIKGCGKSKPTCLIGINTLFEKLLAHKKFKKLNFTALKLTIAGGMKTQVKVKNQWEHLTGSKLMEGYGLTECSPGISTDMINSMHHMTLPGTLVIIRTKQVKSYLMEQPANY